MVFDVSTIEARSLDDLWYWMYELSQLHPLVICGIPCVAVRFFDDLWYLM